MRGKDKQLDLFDLIEDITKESLCEVCKQPCEASLCSEACADAWEIQVFGWLYTDDTIKNDSK